MNFSISNQKLTVIISTKGAELVSLKKDAAEFIWEGNPKFWGKHSPILFPIVGMLKDNRYTYKNKEYTLSRHGFARDLEFEIDKKDSKSIVFSLKSSEETLKSYPFEFELKIGYYLEDDKLEVKYEVLNTSDTAMPFSIGGHPAFALPNDFENYSLQFKEDETLETFYLENDLMSPKNEEIYLSNHILKLNYSLFEKDALIFKKLQSRSIQIHEGQNPILEISFKDFPNLGIWTKQNAPFLCIEPWFGYSDLVESKGNILEKEGIILLNENSSFKTSFFIKPF